MQKNQKRVRRPLKTHFDAVVYFFTRMDAEMISDLLDSNRLYQDFEKSLFVRKLGDLFYDLMALGDSELKAMVDDGALPTNGNYCIIFEGNMSSLYLEVVFEVDEQGMITDIFELIDPVEDFAEDDSKTRHRVFIDQFLDSDFDIYSEEEDEDFYL